MENSWIIKNQQTMEDRVRKKRGTAKSPTLKIKKIITKTVIDYLESDAFFQDCKNKTTNERLRRIMNMLTYLLPKAERISSQLKGLDEKEMAELAELIRNEI